MSACISIIGQTIVNDEKNAPKLVLNLFLL